MNWYLHNSWKFSHGSTLPTARDVRFTTIYIYIIQHVEVLTRCLLNTRNNNIWRGADNVPGTGPTHAPPSRSSREPCHHPLPSSLTPAHTRTSARARRWWNNCGQLTVCIIVRAGWSFRDKGNVRLTCVLWCGFVPGMLPAIEALFRAVDNGR